MVLFWPRKGKIVKMRIMQPTILRGLQDHIFQTYIFSPSPVSSFSKKRLGLDPFLVVRTLPLLLQPASFLPSNKYLLPSLSDKHTHTTPRERMEKVWYMEHKTGWGGKGGMNVGQGGYVCTYMPDSIVRRKRGNLYVGGFIRSFYDISLSLSFFLSFFLHLSLSLKLWFGCMLYNIEENGSMKERGKKNSFLSLYILADIFPSFFFILFSLLRTDRKQQLFHKTGWVVV